MNEHYIDYIKRAISQAYYDWYDAYIAQIMQEVWRRRGLGCLRPGVPLLAVREAT